MDIEKLVELLDEWYHQAHPMSRLKTCRLEANLSQSQLASLSGVPLRTLQQYEQRQKRLDAARADSLLSLAQALHCPPANLLEPA
jgi:transcriptional regulator with XRE-family HTH domain